MAHKLNHVIFSPEKISSTLSRRTLAVAAILVLIVALVSNWDRLTVSDEDRFQAAYDAGNLDLALEIATDMAAENPGSSSPLQAVAAVHIQRALRGGDVEASLSAAMAAAVAAEAISPTDPTVSRLIGYIHELRGDLDGALVAYRRALELAPNDSGSLYQMGLFLDARGRDGEAKSYYQRAVSADVSNDRAHLGLARVFLAEGNVAEAEKQALAATSNAAPEIVADANVVYSLVNMKKGDYAAAAYVAQAAVDLDPDSVAALLALGEAKHAQVFGPGGLPFTETMAEVRALADKAASIDPEDPMAPFLAFKATFALGEREIANGYATKAIALLATSNLSASERDGVRAYIDLLRSMVITPKR